MEDEPLLLDRLDARYGFVLGVVAGLAMCGAPGVPIRDIYYIESYVPLIHFKWATLMRVCRELEELNVLARNRYGLYIPILEAKKSEVASKMKLGCLLGCWGRLCAVTSN